MDILLVLVQIICAPSIFILIVALSKFKYSFHTTITVTALIAVFLVVSDFIAVLKGSALLEPYPFLDFVYRAVNIAIAVGSAICITRQQPDQWLFIILMTLVGVSVVDTISLSIRTLIGLYHMELAFELLLYPLMILLFIRIRRPFLEVIEYMKGKLWALCLVPAFLLSCFALQISFPKRLVDAPDNIPVALMLCGIAITVYVLFYYLFQAMHAKSTLENNAMAMKLSTSSLEKQNNIAAQNEKKISLFKHDLRHITQMMSVCLDSGDIASAHELLSGMDKNVVAWGTSAIQSFTNHKLLDATLCYYIDLAKESGIDITVRVSSMDEIPVDMTELTVVLANALENAVEACKQLPDDERRVLRLDGHRRGKQFFLELVNTCNGEVRFDPDTGLPISRKAGHGLGSQSIAYFAEKNDVVLQYQLEGRYFHLRLLM